jgi:GT2 family glycosyltransferase
VFVVDNGSTDGTAEHLRSAWPDVELIELPENRGFAAAVNEGVEAAASEFVALVNNDMELDGRWLGELVDALRAFPRAASAAGKVLRFDERDVIDGAGDLMSWYGLSVPRGRGEPDDGRYGEPEPVFSATAGAALYRASALRDVGGFDADFFAYAEDVDWGFRAQLLGYECRYVPTARAFHVGRATSSRISGLAHYLFIRNTLTMVLKDYPASALLLHSPRLAMFVGKQISGSIRRGWFRQMMRALRDALAQLPVTLRKRRAVQVRTRVPRRRLDELVLRDYPLQSTVLNFVDARLSGGRD